MAEVLGYEFYAMKHCILGTLLMLNMLSPVVAHGEDRTVVATTTLLRAAIEDITGNRIAIHTLMPPGSCPGHFDLTVEQLAAIEKHGVVFAHGYEPYLPKLKDAVSNPRFRICRIEEKRNWLIPEVYLDVVRKVERHLALCFPEDSIFFSRNLDNLIRKTNAFDREIRKTVEESGLRKKRVICNKFLEDLLAYLGLDVIATYGRAEEMTPTILAALVEAGRSKKVDIVIDNYQAGPDTGIFLAREFNVPHVVLSNFPGAFPGTENIRATLRENVYRMKIAYGKHRQTQ